MQVSLPDFAVQCVNMISCLPMLGSDYFDCAQDSAKKEMLVSEIIVTGCNGFIGTHIVESLLTWQGLQANKKLTHLRFSNVDKAEAVAKDAQLSRVIGVDQFLSIDRFQARRFTGSSRYQFLAHTELDQKLSDGTFKPIAIIHNGACSSTTETNPVIFEELNLSYSKMLFNHCARLEVPFIYASSAAVYGDGDLGFSDSMDSCSSYKPLNLYGKSKIDFDLWALQQKVRPPNWYGLRYFNVYGPFESHKQGQASMVFHGYKQATRLGVINLFKSNTSQFSDGNQLRDFLFVKDIVKLTLFLLDGSLEHSLPKTAAFVNVGTGIARTWNDLAQNVFSSLTLKSKIEYIEMPVTLAKQYQNYTCADVTTLTELGYTFPFVTLEGGVKEYVQRYLARGL